MSATAKNGDKWTGERDGDWWIYQDANGNLYESREVPAYRIRMNGACFVAVDSNRRAIAPAAAFGQ